MSCDGADEGRGFAYGDRVRLVQNHYLTGQVINERNWGDEYLVRLGGTVSAVWLNEIELERDPEFDPKEPADMDQDNEPNCGDAESKVVSLTRGK